MNRFFILNKQENPLKEIIPTAEIQHQVINVLKLTNKNKVICIYEKWELECYWNKNKFSVKNFKIINFENNQKIILMQSIPKNKNISFILQKSTELNVDEIVFWHSRRSISKINDFEKKRNRYRKIIIEASEQSRRSILPKLTLLNNVKDFCFDNLEIIVMYENEKKNLIKNTIKKLNKKNIVIVIGPEGGFCQEEITYFKDKGAHISTFGKNILRVETAAIAALAIITNEIR